MRSYLSNKKRVEYYQIMGIKKIVLFICLLLLSLVIMRIYGGDLSIEIGVITPLIIFVYGFFVNSLLNFIEVKYVNFKQNMADISANTQSFFNLLLLSKQKKVIDETRICLIKFFESLKTLDPKDYNIHQSLLNDVFESLKHYKINSNKNEVLFGRMIFLLSSISVNRERAELFGHRYLKGETKAMFISLNIITITAILFLVIFNLFLLFFGFFLILVLIFISFFIFDLDTNNYGRFKVRSKNVDEILEFLEKQEK